MKKASFIVILALFISVMLLVTVRVKSSNKNMIGKIVFQSDRNTSYRNLCFVDNLEIKYLCEGRMPSFSSKGDKIVYINAEKIDPRTYSNNKLTILDIATNRREELETADLKISQYASPNFSPDGKNVAFAAKIDKIDNIFILNLATGNLEQLTNYGKNDKKYARNFINCLRWTRDNETIIYKVWGAGLFVIDVQEKHVKMLLDGKKVTCGEFDISPDGQRIIFASNGRISNGKVQYKHSKLFLMNFDGTNISQITNNEYKNEYPCWSPDGKKICYTSYRRNSPLVGGELYILNLKDKKEFKLTRAKRAGKKTPFSGWTTDKYPAWAR